LKLLKVLFKEKMEKKAKDYLKLVSGNFDDKDTDYLIEHFRDKDKRKEFFKFYKELEMLYEIISPDAFLRPYIDDYSTITAIYAIVRKAYAKKIYVDKEFQRKTNELIHKRIDSTEIEFSNEFVEINEKSLDKIKEKFKPTGTKVINLVKSIEKIAEDNQDDPFLISLNDRAELIEESWENRQVTTKDAIEKLIKELENDVVRKKEQAEQGFDGLTFFIFKTLKENGIPDAENVTDKIKTAFINNPNWFRAEKEYRELRKKITFAIYAKEDNLDKVTSIVNRLFEILESAKEMK